MVDDWSSRSPPDLITFVPYTWKFKFLLNDFELLTLANEFNWVDTASNNPENAHLAICGKFLQVGLVLMMFVITTMMFVMRMMFATTMMFVMPMMFVCHDNDVCLS